MSADHRFALRVADRLSDPDEVAANVRPDRWRPQSLAQGAAGVALLHTALASSGERPWSRAQQWAQAAAGEGLQVGEEAHLHYGAPALAYTLAIARDGGADLWCLRALEPLEGAVHRIARDRIARARARMEEGRAPVVAEFDALRGLAGLGALLQALDPGHRDLPDVVSCLAEMCEPGPDGLPGWWTPLAPNARPMPDFPAGHSNTGMAHGIAGVLALLASSANTGTAPPEAVKAMERICWWLDSWYTTGPCCPWWPYWTTPDGGGERPASGPRRPSWCYGAAGIARAQQMAAIATGDPVRRRRAEDALAHVLTCPDALATITDACLCHGRAGLARIARAAETDGPGRGFAQAARTLMAPLRDGGAEAADRVLEAEGAFLLDGAAGCALAALDVPLRWDAFLLIDSPSSGGPQWTTA
ncbi:lanthionine synthetase C family protein [Nocardiopsis chromatogenes]|uniref:lanthionine synthetase C family protein n=1 Tax=Nocardiopsis chromatogenes TaxID=280239 RepID=UPI00034C31A1|nr:lanthionine synthetase C family protein [Nocardiopsis chromatogenes]